MFKIFNISAFFVMLVFCVGLAILSQHPVFSLLFLVGCFLFSSCILFSLECEFLAFLFLIIYMGAIAILFLFAVMMLDFKRLKIQKNVTTAVPAGFLIGATFLIFLITEINNFFIVVPFNTVYVNGHINWYCLANSVTEIETLGYFLYSFFALHFLMIGIILLVILFGVVRLTNFINVQKANTEKQQNTTKQLSRYLFN